MLARRSLITVLARAGLLLGSLTGCGDEGGTGGGGTSTSASAGGTPASTSSSTSSSSGGGSGGELGVGGGGGGPVALVFASAWGSALGSTEAALTDGGAWDEVYCQSAAQTLTVIEGDAVGWTKTPNVLRLQQLGETVCGTLEKVDAVPESTTHWGRFYFRNDEVGTTHNHVATYNPIGAIQVALWNRQGTAEGVLPFLRTYYDVAGQSTAYPTNRWAPTGPVANGAWYRYEWMMQYVTPTTYRLWPRVYDAEGTLLLDAETYFQTDYPQSGSDSLATYYAGGGSFGFTDVAIARRFGLGNEGPATSGATEGYWYHADVALSLEGWIGP